ncbi:hypothetical protein EMIHUDRAFT_460932 [Emiliania huxleyi CCMP1516]|uniref:Sugar phosphate transporter domain-containing protein n=2 Tax=Emiliania huxleyi TaxID=2903 RepID=A0A0D3L0N2_EMIH1|nr:hypothetical protein EMIHUDRAFT_460932 [Emiliania huxleyi CCMP1516]EOD41567.1 hypothetical protein EMIHUDRAFT_460932 [Emiliania huxleyi CCMP1516]|eukprot:XP_005793996.1 hypothetical protein EMIHUDRAFT_460932 [Emiliania huxleyi CCMP1516]
MRLRYTTLAVVAALLGAASADRPAPRSALQQRRRLDGLNAPRPVNEGRAAVRRLQGGAGSPKLLRQLKIPLAFTCWYLFSIVYSIANKQVLSAWNFPCTSAAAQLAVGALSVLLLWTPLPLGGEKRLRLRSPPSLDANDVRKLVPVASCLAAGHLLSTVAPAYGTVAFTNVVKTLEPLFTCAFSALLLGQTFPLPVYLSLLPVVFGVCLASASEVSFSAVSLTSGLLSNVASVWQCLPSLLSNVAFALRAIAAKSVMSGGDIGSCLPLPSCPRLDSDVSRTCLGRTAATVEKMGRRTFARQLLLLGTSHYFYNECAFLALSSVHPVTHAVANTVKRVAVILISLVVFRNPLTPAGALGSAVAIGGVFLYSLAKARC